MAVTSYRSMGSSSKSSASVVNEQQNQQQLVSAHRESRKKGGIISAALQDPSIRDHLDEQIQDCLRPQLSIRKLDIAKGRKKEPDANLGTKTKELT